MHFVFTKRKVFNFAVSILKLVECEGIEPLVATLLNVTIGLQPTTGNTLH